MAKKHLPENGVDKLLRILFGIEQEPTVSNLIAATVI
jgi:hypothetical protein